MSLWWAAIEVNTRQEIDNHCQMSTQPCRAPYPINYLPQLDFYALGLGLVFSLKTVMTVIDSRFVHAMNVGRMKRNRNDSMNQVASQRSVLQSVGIHGEAQTHVLEDGTNGIRTMHSLSWIAWMQMWITFRQRGRAIRVIEELASSSAVRTANAHLDSCFSCRASMLSH